MFRRLLTAVLTAVALGASPLVSRAQTIDTRPPLQGSSWFGFTSGVMLGETFSTPGPSNSFLNTIAIYQVKVDAGQPTTYTAFVANWDNITNTSGTQVWSASGSNLTNAYSDFSFAANTPLVFGQQYIFAMFIDASFGNFSTGGTPYAGGGFYYHSGPNTTGAWSGEFSADNDLAFSADFSTVPEPNSLILLGSGLVGLAGVAFRGRYLLG